MQAVVRTELLFYLATWAACVLCRCQPSHAVPLSSFATKSAVASMMRSAVSSGLLNIGEWLLSTSRTAVSPPAPLAIWTNICCASTGSFIVSRRRQIPTRHIHSGRVGMFAALCQCLQRLFPQLTRLKLPLVFGQIAEHQFPGIDGDLGTPGLGIGFLGRRRDTHAAQEGTISQ